MSRTTVQCTARPVGWMDKSPQARWYEGQKSFPGGPFGWDVFEMLVLFDAGNEVLVAWVIFRSGYQLLQLGVRFVDA